MRPRCPSVGPNGYRCRRRVHGPVPAEPVPPIEECHRAWSWQGLDAWDDETAIEPPAQAVSFGTSVEWDVTRLLAAAEGKPVVQATVGDYVAPDAVNKSHWRSVDVHTPIILAPHPEDGRLVCLDGRHRLYKAWRLGRPLIAAVVLTRDEERACRMSEEERHRFGRMLDAANRYGF